MEIILFLIGIGILAVLFYCYHCQLKRLEELIPNLDRKFAATLDRTESNITKNIASYENSIRAANKHLSDIKGIMERYEGNAILFNNLYHNIDKPLSLIKQQIQHLEILYRDYNYNTSTFEKQ